MNFNEGVHNSSVTVKFKPFNQIHQGFIQNPSQLKKIVSRTMKCSSEFKTFCATLYESMKVMKNKKSDKLYKLCIETENNSRVLILNKIKLKPSLKLSQLYLHKQNKSLQNAIGSSAIPIIIKKKKNQFMLVYPGYQNINEFSNQKNLKKNSYKLAKYIWLALILLNKKIVKSTQNLFVTTEGTAQNVLHFHVSTYSKYY